MSSKLKEKVLEDLIEKLHMLPETMGQVKDEKKPDATIAIMMGDKGEEDSPITPKTKEELEEEEEEDEE